MTRVLHVPADPRHNPTFEEVHTLEDRQPLVGGYIEAVRLGSRLAHADRELLVYANEEGRLLRLPFNPRISALFAETHTGDHTSDATPMILGDCYLVGLRHPETGREDGDDHDFPWPEAHCAQQVYRTCCRSATATIVAAWKTYNQVNHLRDPNEESEVPS